MNARSSACDGADDGLLVLAVKRGDEAAFNALYRKYATAVYALTLRELGNADLAGEVTHLAFVRLWERAGTIRVESLRLRAWLLKVAHNAAVDHARRRRPTTALEEIAGTVAAERADDHVLRSERATAVRVALDALPADQRTAVELAYFGGLTQVEISHILHEPLGTIKGRIRLAMRRLRESLEPSQEEFA